jgi:hypothetical protein
MTLEPFPEANAVYAKDQAQYLPMPAHTDRSGVVTCCWKLTWAERLSLLLTGRIWHQILTFRKPLQPQLLLVDKPHLEP